MKIVWKTKITFLLSKTCLSFSKQKYILFLATYFFKILIKHLIASAFFLPRQILKTIDMPRQKPRHLPIAEVNFECWVFLLQQNNFQYQQNTHEKHELNFSRGALIQIKTRVCFKYFVHPPPRPHILVTLMPLT